MLSETAGKRGVARAGIELEWKTWRLEISHKLSLCNCCPRKKLEAGGWAAQLAGSRIEIESLEAVGEATEEPQPHPMWDASEKCFCAIKHNEIKIFSSEVRKEENAAANCVLGSQSLSVNHCTRLRNFYIFFRFEWKETKKRGEKS